MRSPHVGRQRPPSAPPSGPRLRLVGEARAQYVPTVRWTSFLVFFGVLAALDLIVHRYLYVRLFRTPAWSPGTQRLGAIALTALGLFVLVAFATVRELPRSVGSVMAFVAYIWMGAVFYLLLTTLGFELVRLAGFVAAQAAEWWPSLSPPPAPDRRLFLARAAAQTSGIIATGVTAQAIRSARGEIMERTVEVKLERLPRQLSGLTIVQLSDVHIGPTIGQKFIDSIVAKTEALRPDLVAITGDLVDGSVEMLRPHAAPLGRIDARFGKYFCTGNHEYYSGAAPWIAELDRLGFQTLADRRVTIGDRGASIDLAGVNDPTAIRFGLSPADGFQKIAKDRDEERELVLLAHQPRSIEQADALGAGLQLSGHTHGGQLWPFTHLVSLVHPYVAGLHRHSERTQIYVSRGTGYWGPPMRIGAPAEITKIVLVPA